MQYQKSVAVILVALMMTGCAGYFLQTSHHPVETITYDYAGDSTPSVQASQIDDWTTYNPLKNVTGWGDKSFIPRSEDSQGHAVANQYLISSTVTDYTESAPTSSTPVIIPQNAQWYGYGPNGTYGHKLNIYWAASAGIGGITAQGPNSTYPQNTSLKENAILLPGSPTIYGGYTQTGSANDFTNYPTGRNYSYSAQFTLNTVVKAGNTTITSSDTQLASVTPLSSFSFSGLTRDSVVKLNDSSNFYLMGNSTINTTYGPIEERSIGIDRFYSADITTTFTINCTDAGCTGFIYDGDQVGIWYPARENADGIWERINNTPYNSNEIVVMSNQISQIRLLVPKVEPASYADPIKFVSIPAGKSTTWGNGEVNGVISFLCTSNLEFVFSTGTVAFPSSVPYDFVYVTLDLLNQTFTYRGATVKMLLPDNPADPPVPTTTGYTLADYVYTMDVTGSIPSFVGKRGDQTESLVVRSIQETYQTTTDVSGNIANHTITIGDKTIDFGTNPHESAVGGHFLAVNTMSDSKIITIDNVEYTLPFGTACYDGEVVPLQYIGVRWTTTQQIFQYRSSFSDDSVMYMELAIRGQSTGIWYNMNGSAPLVYTPFPSVEVMEDWDEDMMEYRYLASARFGGVTTLTYDYSDTEWTIHSTRTYNPLGVTQSSSLTLTNNILGTTNTMVGDDSTAFSAQGVPCIGYVDRGSAKVVVDNTVVQVDPLGLLWGNPQMYLGYFFSDQMNNHNTRLLFNGFVKFGSSITINGETFDIRGTNIIVPIWEYLPIDPDDESSERTWQITSYKEYPIKGMAVDFIDGRVTMVFTESNNDTYPVGGWDENDPGKLNRDAIVVPRTYPQMSSIVGFTVSAEGTWYWQSGLYTIEKSTEEQYGFLLDGSFGLTIGGACLLMVGLIILGIAVMNYGFKWEFSILDWVITVIAIIFLLVLGLGS